MALANHEAPLDVGVDAAFSETSLYKVSIVVEKQDKGTKVEACLTLNASNVSSLAT